MLNPIHSDPGGMADFAHYIFTPPALGEKVPSASGARRMRVARRRWPCPKNPRSRSLPFQNMSGDPEQEYFADGMDEEIITAPSRIRWLFVIARDSSSTYKGLRSREADRPRAWRSRRPVRKAGDRVRITAQLINATTGAHLWAARFDRSLGDVFDLQDKVAPSAAGVSIRPGRPARADVWPAARQTT
jgi:TolB-like protein